MTATLPLPGVSNLKAERTRAPAWGGWFAVAAAVALAWWLTRAGPGWLTMWAIAATEFFGLKLATLRGRCDKTALGRLPGYLFLWPGMNAAAFLAVGRSRSTGILPVPLNSSRAGYPRTGEAAFALAKLVIGLVFASWAALHAADATMPPLVIGWIGMLGIIFTLHFGVFHLVSWLWRAAGVDAPPIMRAPIAATSLAEFWSGRWNIAFSEAARRFLMRPLARRVGARTAGIAVFTISGLLHETVISLPARGGWGGPTLYFLLHALGIAVEKSAAGIRLGLGRGIRGWMWTLFVAVAPLPLLFHEPFVRNVIVPLYRSLAALLP